jgi:hypothetical protein
MKNSIKVTLACLVILVIGFVAFLGQRALADESTSGCAKECGTCQKSCEKADAYLKGKAQSASSTAAQKSIADCIQLCKTSQVLMENNSKYHPAVCKVCAEACTACAKACDALHDKELKACIEECKTCASSCKKMAG